MKAFRIFLLVLIVIGVILLLTQKLWVPKLVNQILMLEGADKKEGIPPKQAEETATPPHITTKKINEENFSGTIAVISGKSTLAIKMQEYIDAKVASFRKEANTDVPDMREKFGEDNPSANYEIDINSKYIKGSKTESIVTDVYFYTGGAHGSTVYKVITVNQTSGKVLALANVIKKEEQKAFTEFVKKQLNAWQPDGSAVVFPDMVKELEFDSFANWSLHDENLNIYFDQYAIGPGVLGAVVFPLSVEKIKNFLQSF